MNKVLLAIALTSASFGSASSHAQSYPDRPITIVVPFAPAGGVDVLSRLVGKAISDDLKVLVVVDNRTGGNGVIGMDAVKRAKPDGYTLLGMATSPLMDEANIRAFSMVSLYTETDYLLVVNPSVKANTVAELVALAKSNPNGLAFGSSGSGSASHLAAELFKSMSKTDMVHVPYRGMGQAVNDLLGGHVQLMFAPPQTVISYVRSGALRAIAATGSKPLTLLPNVPTVGQSGVPGYEARGWFGLIAPAGVPAAIVNKLNQEVRQALRQPELLGRLRELGGEPSSLTPEEFLRYVRADNAKWSKLIAERGIEINN